ncbi:MAG: glycosyltransferase family 2 protein [Acidobacteria bacterium]|nr:glycosyltransferase family 2 protein [Acidobacteriota bacterium]
MKLSIVIPAYNEAATLEEVLRRVRATPFEKEILVVDDASTDGTADLVLRHQAPDLILLQHPHNRGKGAALRTGFERATGDIVVVQDADLEYDPADYGRLLKPILDGRADVVFGSRFGGESHRVLFYWHYLGNRFLTTLSNMFTNLNLTDMETGYKAFRIDVLRDLKLRSNRFGFEPEITAKVARMGCRVYEVAISYHGRGYDAGKKITWRDGLAAIGCIIRYRFFG